MSVVIPILLVIHVAICLLMVLLVLMQRPRSEGLGAAFGGGMTDNLFGAQTTHVLQKFTVYLGVGFFALTLHSAILFSKATAKSTLLERELLSTEEASVPAQTPPPASEVPAPAAEGIEIVGEAIEIPAPISAPATPAAPAAPTETAPVPSARDEASPMAPESQP